MRPQKINAIFTRIADNKHEEKDNDIPGEAARDCNHVEHDETAKEMGRHGSSHRVALAVA